MPEVLWKAYIDFEISEGEADNVRSLYERLLDRTSHVKVWMAYAQFECSDKGGGTEVGRQVFQRGYDSLKEQGLKEERVMLLEAWRECEQSPSEGQSGDVQLVDKLMPRKMKMRRAVHGGDDDEYEDYYDYQFPDDAKPVVGLKILEQAMKWKQQMAAMGSAESEDPSSEASRKRTLSD